jgi:hypothetical protein
VESLRDDLLKTEKKMGTDHAARKTLINNRWILTSKSVHSWPLRINDRFSDKPGHNEKRKKKDKRNDSEKTRSDELATKKKGR